jgi:hypothetical protein
MKPFIHTIGRVKTIVNGDILEDSMVDATYNGNKLDISAFDKGIEKHIQLTNDDIMKLLSKPASSNPLENRLINDFFNVNIKKDKKNIKKTIKKTHNKKYKKTSTNKKSYYKRY